jgi:hypothetical protein
MTEPLLALSFLQPWLWAILERHKGFAIDGRFYAVENRSKPPPRKMIGQRFALHASAGWDARGERFVDNELLGVAESPPRTICDRGVIVGTAQLVAGVRAAERIPDLRGNRLGAVETMGPFPLTRPAVAAAIASPWAFGPWVWLLTDLRKLSEPVPAKGMLGFWKVPPAAAALVREREVA